MNENWKDISVLEIRALYDTGLYSYKQLSVKYQIAPETVFQIVKRLTWKWVA